jgi:hypothetical protein
MFVTAPQIQFKRHCHSSSDSLTLSSACRNTTIPTLPFRQCQSPVWTLSRVGLDTSPHHPVQVQSLFFLDLIRHGKHAKAANPSPAPKEVTVHAVPPPPAKEQPSPKSRRQEAPQHIDLTEVREDARVTTDAKGNIAFANQPPISTPFAKEAELIVQEERETKSKLPTYKGLEHFKLIEKMGE